jgi:hypothetical protein
VGDAGLAYSNHSTGNPPLRETIAAQSSAFPPNIRESDDGMAQHLMFFEPSDSKPAAENGQSSAQTAE